MGGFDVDPSLLSMIEMFIKEKCNRALCIRKGWHSFTSSYANYCQAQYFKFENVEQGSQRVVGWDGTKKTPDEHVIHYKQLQDTTSLYTFVGMVGYCMKNIDENHLQIMHHNVNGRMMKIGMLEFVKCRDTTMKN
jgi:hypothetical protein